MTVLDKGANMVRLSVRSNKHRQVRLVSDQNHTWCPVYTTLHSNNRNSTDLSIGTNKVRFLLRSNKQR